MFIKGSLLLHTVVLLLLSALYTHAMVYDNRYFPLIQRNETMVYHEPSAFGMSFFYSSGDSAINTKNTATTIPELYGEFDLETLAKGMVAMGFANPLPTEWQRSGTSIPFGVKGKVESVGAAFNWHQRIADQWAFGTSWLFMGVQSEQQFHLLTSRDNNSNRCCNLVLQSGDVLLLDAIARQALGTIGITKNHVSQRGFGDIDAYIQWGDQWEYALKCRSVKAGGRIGGLFPTGVTHDPNLPASIPFGGDGYWGIYATGYGSFEIREDMFVGLVIRLSKRFKRTRLQRVSTVGEPSIFGAAVVPVSIDPGMTVVVSPFAVLENIRQGFALGLSYTLIKHQGDTWCTNCSKAEIQEQLKRSKNLSEWGSSYVTLSAQYDFGTVKMHRAFEPILSFRWDWPINFLVTRQAAKSNKISIDLDFVF